MFHRSWLGGSIAVAAEPCDSVDLIRGENGAAGKSVDAEKKCRHEELIRSATKETPTVQLTDQRGALFLLPFFLVARLAFLFERRVLGLVFRWQSRHRFGSAHSRCDTIKRPIISYEIKSV